MQDCGTAQGPSNTLTSAASHLADWHDVGGGEAGYVVSDPSDPNIVYAGEYLGIITRYDHRTRQSRNVSAWPDNPSGWGGEDMNYRFQWTAPIHVSPHDPKVVYHGAQVLFRTRDGGQTLGRRSARISRATTSRSRSGPAARSPATTPASRPTAPSSRSPSRRSRRALIWAGSDDGLVHVTRDGGKNWTNVTGGDARLPRVGHGQHHRAVAVRRRHGLRRRRRPPARRHAALSLQDRRTTARPGSGCTATLPPDVYLHAVREDPARRGQLYLGTERGVMFSTDDGATWRPLRLNLPTVAVHDLAVKDDDLVVGTHGRSIWILDDLQPVRE